jgi:hypothetical protein
MEFVNGHDDALLLIGADDGSCRIWRDFIRTGSRSSNTTFEYSTGVYLVSAWNCIAEMAPSTRCSGLVLDWNQDSCPRGLDQVEEIFLIIFTNKILNFPFRPIALRCGVWRRISPSF